MYTNPKPMQRDAYFFGFPLWKRPFIQRFFLGYQHHFVKEVQSIPEGATLYAWGMSISNLDVPQGVQLVRIEDGFMRSVGLGAERAPPLSWVMDSDGIYYDATRPSGLENILNNHTFDEKLIQRAKALKSEIIKNGVTKYNLNSASWQRPNNNKTVILVPGQVESDQSIQYGAPKNVCPIKTNLDLLKAVKKANPKAYVIYKPHPDVLAGYRARGKTELQTQEHADEIILNASISQLLERVDEVHTITSLTGFEALLRGKMVTCYGQPFYSGWQLTKDLYPCTRRKRTLAIDELVAAAYILYPTYVSISRNQRCSPEEALQEIIASSLSAPKPSLAQRLQRAILRLNKY